MSNFKIWWQNLSIKDKRLYSIIAIAVFVILIGIGIGFYCYYKVMDVEYLGHYVVSVSYEEPWNEYIHRTCTRTVHDGTDANGNSRSHTETYDCSYVEEHYAQYYFQNERGEGTIITEYQYHQICKYLGTKPKFVDMHRDYHTKDGDKYITYFDGNRNHMWTLTEKHLYKNKVKNSKSVFNFSDVSNKDKKKYKLYDYPDDFDYYKDQNPIMGYDSHSAVVDSFQYLNAYYGGKYQFRCYVMIWRNMPIETATMEQNYLIGGNKNELIVCMSVDSMEKVQWIYAFSWEDNPYIAVGVNHLYDKGERLNLMKLNRYLLKQVPLKWKRKEFKDFEYINH